MCCARALPITQLMPAVGSQNPSLRPPQYGVDLLQRLSGRTLSAARTPGTPSIIMSPDFPWTQIRPGAGTHRTTHLPAPIQGASP
jgi:hypothetical protein